MENVQAFNPGRRCTEQKQKAQRERVVLRISSSLQCPSVLVGEGRAAIGWEGSLGHI